MIPGVRVLCSFPQCAPALATVRRVMRTDLEDPTVALQVDGDAPQYPWLYVRASRCEVVSLARRDDG